MIYNLDKIIRDYPSLQCRSSSAADSVIIEGNFVVNAEYSDISFLLDYSIYAELFNEENKVPIIKETGGKIDRKYPHVNKDGSLCLEISSEILDKCTDAFGFNAEVWFNTFVISYFYSYRYYKEYGRYPFGERKHGVAGILEYYQQKFGVETQAKSFECLSYSANHRYRGHLPCPCGSGKRIRNCHSKELWEAQIPSNKKRIQMDYKIIREEQEMINRYERIKYRAKQRKDAYATIRRSKVF